MSKPLNPLTQYRSYSYYHVLVACDSTATAEALAESNEFAYNSAFAVNTHKPQTIAHRSFDAAGELQLQTQLSQTGQYVVILNGNTNAEFMISDVSWSSQIVPKIFSSDDPLEHFTTLALEGEMTVIEPLGVRFMNVLIQACNDLKTDPTGVVWLLKTIFVGHGWTPESGEFSEPITNIKPLMFLLFDITADFDQRGGVYKIGLVGINDGAAKLPQYIAAGENLSFSLCNGPTLEGALKAFEDEVNRRYNKYYEEQNKVLLETINSVPGLRTKLGLPADATNVYRRIQYRFILQGKYRSNPEKYKIETSKLCQTTGKKTPDPIFSFGESPQVESCLRQIIESCPQIGEDAKENKPTGRSDNDPPCIYKIHSTINSTNDVVIVTYTIRDYPVKTTGLIERVLGNSANGQTVEDLEKQFERQKDLIIFDYIYSGKNIDIKTFNIHMDMGLSFFMTMVTADGLAGKVSDMGRQDLQAVAAAKDAPSTPTGALRINTPLFPPRTLKKTTSKGVSNPRAHGDFQSLLAKHAATETMSVTMEIVGNPMLLSDTTQFPSEIARGANVASIATGKTTNVQSFDKVTSTRIFPNWSWQPALVKVNIFMPSTDEANSIRKQRGEHQLFAEKFWYDGFYVITLITHKFSGGEFTQELEMMSLPRETLYGSGSDADSKQRADLEQQVREECAKNLGLTKDEPAPIPEPEEQIDPAATDLAGGPGSCENPSTQTGQDVTKAAFETCVSDRLAKLNAPK